MHFFQSGGSRISSFKLHRHRTTVGSSTLKEYEAKRLTDLCHVDSQKDVYLSAMPEVTKDMEKKWAERISRCKRYPNKIEKVDS